MKQEKSQERRALRKRVGEFINQMPFYTRSELNGYSEDEDDEDECEDEDEILFHFQVRWQAVCSINLKTWKAPASVFREGICHVY